MKAICTIIGLCVAITVSAQKVTEKNQSVTLNILGLQYNYENPLGESTTVIFHGGVAGALGYSSKSLFIYHEEFIHREEFHSSLRAVAGTDFRYYYNLGKRAANGKNTKRNSANFLAVDLQVYTPAFYTHNWGYTSTAFVISPYWGLKRVYNNNWLLEVNLGMNTALEAKNIGWGLKMDFKVGYSF